MQVQSPTQPQRRHLADSVAVRAIGRLQTRRAQQHQRKMVALSYGKLYPLGEAEGAVPPLFLPFPSITSTKGLLPLESSGLAVSDLIYCCFFKNGLFCTKKRSCLLQSRGPHTTNEQVFDEGTRGS